MKIKTPINKTDLVTISWLAGILLVLDIIVFTNIIDSIFVHTCWFIAAMLSILLIWMVKQTYDLHAFLSDELKR